MVQDGSSSFYGGFQSVLPTGGVGITIQLDDSESPSGLGSILPTGGVGITIQLERSHSPTGGFQSVLQYGSVPRRIPDHPPEEVVA
jgi:hypothetical protein